MGKAIFVLSLVLGLGMVVRGGEVVDEAGLARLFGRVVGGDFEVVGHRVALLDPTRADSGAWLVMEVRARRAGNFTIGCEWKAGDARHRQEYYLVIAEAGRPLFYCWGADMKGPHPAGRVGDTVVVAFAVPANAGDVRFYREPAEARIAAIWFDAEKEMAAKEKGNAEFAVDNGAADHLIVKAKQNYSAVTESGSSTHHTSGLVLEAKSPGRFDLVIGPKNAGDESQVVPVVIVPREESLRLLAMHCGHEERSGTGSSDWVDEHEINTIVMRVGERVSMNCDFWITNKGDAPEAGRPRGVGLAEKKFEAQGGSFGFTGLAEGMFMGSPGAGKGQRR